MWPLGQRQQQQVGSETARILGVWPGGGDFPSKSPSDSEAPVSSASPLQGNSSTELTAHLKILACSLSLCGVIKTRKNKGNFVPKPLEAPLLHRGQSRQWRLWQSQTIRVRVLPLTLSHSFCIHPSWTGKTTVTAITGGCHRGTEETAPARHQSSAW